MTTNARKIQDFHAHLAVKAASTVDLSHLLRSLLSEVFTLLQASSGSVMLHDPETDRLRLYVSARHPGLPRRQAVHGRTSLPLEGSVAGQVFREGKPIIVKDVSAGAKDLPLRRPDAGGSFLSIPLRIHRRTIGVLNLNRAAGEGNFTPRDLRLLDAVKGQIVSLVEKGRLIDQLERRKNDIQGLYTLSGLLFSAHPFSETLHHFLEQLGQQLGVEQLAVFRLVEFPTRTPSDLISQANFDVLAAHHLPVETLEGLFFQIRNRLQDDLSRPWVPEWDDPQLQPPVALPFDHGRKRMALFCFPILVQDGFPHFLVVSQRRRRYDAEETLHHYRFLHMVVGQLRVAIEREYLLRRLEHDQRRLEEHAKQNKIYLDISMRLSSNIDPYLVLQEAFREFRQLVPFSTISLLIHDELDDRFHLIIQAERSLGSTCQEELVKRIIDTFVNEYAAGPTLPDPATVVIDPLPPLSAGKPGQTLEASDSFFPVILDRKINGLIHLTRAADQDFPADFLGITSRFVGIFLTSIKNARIHKRTEKLAFTDPLTSLYNHRYFQDTLRVEFERAKRYQNPLSLLILDIDFFKRFNDTYGHLVGDKVLQHVATIFGQQVRGRIDTVARYGGEEFAIVLPETPLTGAGEMGERIRSSVERTPLLLAGKSLGVTLSIGLACTNQAVWDKPSDLIHAADIALYQAKENGRNQVRLYEEAAQHHV